MNHSPFVRGYIEAMRAGQAGWYRHHPSGEMRRWAAEDLAPEALERITEDCEGGRSAFANSQEGGRQFFANRQRGAYAVNGGLRPLTVYIGGDGKVRFKD